MATAAEPRPAELPLPGGRDGAKVKLHPILTATVRGPIAWFLREDGRFAWRKAFGFGVPKDQWVTAPIQCFLVEHPSAGPALVDTANRAGLLAAGGIGPALNALKRLGDDNQVRTLLRFAMSDEVAELRRLAGTSIG